MDTNSMTETRCCAKDCATVSSIRQPLKLGTVLVLHVPLCAGHAAIWTGFAKRQAKALRDAAERQRNSDWLFDAALAIDLFPPGKPL